ncbi:MAG: hypothetical protein MUC97_12285 [Bernardetiaceae bacterium]|jgi:hypothetical protein|nr:hypothetical protein [Bernardetiaceae bacterium]
MLNLTLNAEQIQVLKVYYEAEKEKLQAEKERINKSLAEADEMLKTLKKKIADAPAAAADGPVKKVKGKPGPKKKEKKAAEVAEEAPKTGRSGYLRLNYESFIVDTIKAKDGLVHTSEFQEALVSKNKLKGDLVKKAEQGISRALSILKNQKDALSSVKIPGKAGLSYGLREWFNEAGDYIK